MRPLVEHQHAVGERQGLVDVVGHQQDAGAVALPEVEHQAVHRDAGQRVEGAERLVEQQQLGAADERTCQRGALGLAAGERERPGLGALGQPDLVERGERGLARVGAVQAERDVVGDAAPGQQARLLEGDGHRARHVHLAGHPVAAGVVEAGEHPQQRALARAAATEQRDELAVGDGDVEAVEDASIAERAGQAAHLGGAHRFTLSGRHARALRSSRRTRASVPSPSRA